MGNFEHHVDMQAISKTLLVFVDIELPPLLTDTLKDLCRRCRVSKTPYAVIADKYGNPIAFDVSTQRPDHLRTQIQRAQRDYAALCHGLSAALAKAKDFCRERDYKAAASTLYGPHSRGYVGIPAAEEIGRLLARINEYHERQIAKVLQSDRTDPHKRETLDRLKRMVCNKLPVYDKITSVSRDIARTSS